MKKIIFFIVIIVISILVINFSRQSLTAEEIQQIKELPPEDLTKLSTDYSISGKAYAYSKINLPLPTKLSLKYECKDWGSSVEFKLYSGGQLITNSVVKDSCSADNLYLEDYGCRSTSQGNIVTKTSKKCEWGCSESACINIPSSEVTGSEIIYTAISLDATGTITINVKNDPYNAIGDGIHDDSLAIQKALDYASQSKVPVKVYFPTGIYFTDKTLIIGNSTEIYGEGKNTILKRSNSETPYNDVIYNKDCSVNSTFHGRTLFWNSRYRCGNEKIYLHDFAIDGSLIQLNDEKNGPKAPTIGFAAIKDTRIENIYFKDLPQDGIFLYAGGVNISVRNNTIDGFNMKWYNGGGINIEMRSATANLATGEIPVIIENNNIIVRAPNFCGICKLSEIKGIAINKAAIDTGNVYPHVIVRKNTLHLTNKHQGISCNNCVDSLIEGNTMMPLETGTEYSGIYTGIDSENVNENVIIKNNVIIGNGKSDDGRGILLSGTGLAGNAVIENNKVINKTVITGSSVIEIRWFNGFQVNYNTIKNYNVIYSHGLAIGAGNCGETRTTTNGVVKGNSIDLPNVISPYKPLVSRKTLGTITYQDNNVLPFVIC